ncbi:hypothetical protein BDA99DRAFT_433014 [Phascolomyces articulosus]|uniref:Uncharacterized protein n=1 Tax=Phascolomyces articulosus TaxID=60185 RepID=A0AAD5PHT0_9FUNG|nr:hypothetical protein BDA99DRAFT_433014 [Phascolomyces articulosus]
MRDLQLLNLNDKNGVIKSSATETTDKKDEEEDDAPYPNNKNFINSLRPEDRLFFDKAVPHFKQISDGLIKVPLSDVFNWNDMAERLGKEVEGKWYMVAFYSKRKVDCETKQLIEEDDYIHELAKKSGGLLQLWSGKMNEDRESLTVSIWVDREHALNGTRRQPFHRKASGHASKLFFESYKLERYNLIKRAGETVFHIETY